MKLKKLAALTLLITICPATAFSQTLPKTTNIEPSSCYMQDRSGQITDLSKLCGVSTNNNLSTTRGSKIIRNTSTPTYTRLGSNNSPTGSKIIRDTSTPTYTRLGANSKLITDTSAPKYTRLGYGSKLIRNPSTVDNSMKP